MFGYVTAHEPELKVKDFAKYKSYYCGLCQNVKEKIWTSWADYANLRYDIFNFASYLSL